LLDFIDERLVVGRPDFELAPVGAQFNDHTVNIHIVESYIGEVDWVAILAIVDELFILRTTLLRLGSLGLRYVFKGLGHSLHELGYVHAMPEQFVSIHRGTRIFLLT